MALRVGAENRTKVIIASVLGVLALILVGRAILSTFGSNDSEPASLVSSAPAAPVGSGGKTAQQLPSASQLDPTLHPEKMELAESTQYHGNGRNIFSKNSAPVDIPKPIAPARPGPPPPPPGPPPPPPIDLRFYGFASKQGGKPRIFLLQGEEVYIASEGEVVARRYRVGQISANSVMIQDMPNNNTQSIPLSQN
jgi:hypothetical protein